jgi:predicted nucleotidyltransferase component of viral defense system
VSAPRDLVASVHRRLLNLARERREELEYLLTRYALERLLFRLSASPHANQFVLKGAVLFVAWTDQPHRATRDLDFLSYGDPAPSRLATVFRDLCATPVVDDGLVFDPESVHASPIREAQQYEGVRVRLTARLGTARLPLQIDIGFGDAVTPAPVGVTVPALLNLPAPLLRAYPRETVVAEKFQAMVMLGIANSRMKDFYDLWTLARLFAFDGLTLTRAMAATFERRQTAMPADPPLALTSAFSADTSKQAQWRAFMRRGRLVGDAPNLAEIITALGIFLTPPARALIAARPFTQRWTPGGPWRPDDA